MPKAARENIGKAPENPMDWLEADPMADTIQSAGKIFPGPPRDFCFHEYLFPNTPVIYRFVYIL